MEGLKDYVFFTILKDDDKTKEDGISYGIKRGSCKNHEPYFRAFLEINCFAFEDGLIKEDWDSSCRNIARDGNVMIVNTAVEIDKIEDRMYAIYLPTFPTLFQLKELGKALKEFQTIDFDVSVYGEDEAIFRELRLQNEFDSTSFLKRYIKYHKSRLLRKEFAWFEHSNLKEKIYKLV